MRLTKFFPQTKSIDRSINAWVREKPKQRLILQMLNYENGVLVLYEKTAARDEWESIKKAFADKTVKPAAG